MRLSDIMSAMHLERYAEVALVIFFVVFVLIAIRVLRDRSGKMDEAARIPFDSDPHDEAEDCRDDKNELQFGGQL